MKEADINEHLQTIADLRAKIATLEDQLNNAMSSGDEAMQKLKKQLMDLGEDYDQFKVKSKREFDEMESNLTTKHKREIDALKEKYERMLAELRNNANSDKEFIQMEL